MSHSAYLLYKGIAFGITAAAAVATVHSVSVSPQGDHSLLVTLASLSTAGITGGMGVLLLSAEPLTLRRITGRLLTSAVMGTGAGLLSLVIASVDSLEMIATAGILPLIGVGRFERILDKILERV